MRYTVTMLKALVETLSRPKYTLLTLVVAWSVFTAAIFVPNYQLFLFGIALEGVGVWPKIPFILSFYASIFTNFTPVSAILTVVIAIMFGLNVALLTYYIRAMQGAAVGALGATSVGGLVSGFFGIGCAACGSIIVTSLLSLIGAGGLLALLPFGGEEFAFVAVVLLSYSLWQIGKKIHVGKVC